MLTPERFGAVAARVAGTPLEAQVMAELAGMGQLAEHRAQLAASPRVVDDAPGPSRAFRPQRAEEELTSA